MVCTGGPVYVYGRDRDSKDMLAYNEFTYKKTNHGQSIAKRGRAGCFPRLTNSLLLNFIEFSPSLHTLVTSVMKTFKKSPAVFKFSK